MTDPCAGSTVLLLSDSARAKQWLSECVLAMWQMSAGKEKGSIRPNLRLLQLHALASVVRSSDVAAGLRDHRSRA